MSLINLDFSLGASRRGAFCSPKNVFVSRRRGCLCRKPRTVSLRLNNLSWHHSLFNALQVPSWHTLLWDSVVKPVVDNAVCQNNVETTKAESNDFWHVYKLHSSFCHLFRLTKTDTGKERKIIFLAATENPRWFSRASKIIALLFSYIHFCLFILCSLSRFPFLCKRMQFCGIFLLMHRASLSGWNGIRQKGWVAWYCSREQDTRACKNTLNARIFDEARFSCKRSSKAIKCFRAGNWRSLNLPSIAAAYWYGGGGVSAKVQTNIFN